MTSAKLARFTQITSRAALSPPLVPLAMPSNFKSSLRRSSLPGPTFNSSTDTEELTSLYTSILSGIRNNIPPEHHASDGLGGVYLLKDKSNVPAAIFKPLDEESVPTIDDASLAQVTSIGKEVKPGLFHGEGYAKEIAAYLLDPEHFHSVPPTTLYHCAHPLFIKDKFLAKTGSLQKYIPHACTSEDMGSSSFPVDEVHKIGLLDCRLMNADRHMGNILVVKSGASYRLIPIDHGMCLPSSLSEGYFEWLSFSQAKKPFSKETLAYIARLDPDTEIRMLRKHLPFIRLECLATLKICTKFLQKAAKKGYTLYEIGCMMTRYHNQEEPSQLERIKLRVENRMQATSNNHSLDFWEIFDDETNKVLKKK